MDGSEQIEHVPASGAADDTGWSVVEIRVAETIGFVPRLRCHCSCSVPTSSFGSPLRSELHEGTLRCFSPGLLVTDEAVRLSSEGGDGCEPRGARSRHLKLESPSPLIAA